MHMHGPDGVRFYTRLKTVTARWPTGSEGRRIHDADDEVMFGLMMQTPLLITGIMRHAERINSKTEIVSVTAENPRHRCTLGDVFRRARKLANALTRAGVQPGDRIATLAWNDYRHLELYYAVSCIGAILHTLNPRLFPEQLKYIINHAADRMLFADSTVMPLVEKLKPALTTVERIVVLSNDSYEAFIADESESFEWPDLDERTASSLCYTSGTTGNPKGVLFDHRSTVLHSYGSALVDTMGFGRADNDARGRADVPRQCLGPAVLRTDGRREARVPGTEDGRRRDARGADRRGEGDARRRRADRLAEPARLYPRERHRARLASERCWSAARLARSRS